MTEQKIFKVGLCIGLGIVAGAASAAPAVPNVGIAVARLRARTGPTAKASVKAVTQACRGKLRHALRDHAGLLKATIKMSTAKDPAVRIAALDLDKCFRPKTFVKVLGPRIEDESPAVIIYAAEVAARVADPVVLAPLIAAWDKRKESCLKPGLNKEAVEVCVWLTYAPGAALGGADASQRKAAADRAVAMFQAPYAKVREVAVETVASARLKANAAAIKTLIKDEKGKKYAVPNSAGMLTRFNKRYRALR